LYTDERIKKNIISYRQRNLDISLMIFIMLYQKNKKDICFYIGLINMFLYEQNGKCKNLSEALLFLNYGNEIGCVKSNIILGNYYKSIGNDSKCCYYYEEVLKHKEILFNIYLFKFYCLKKKIINIDLVGELNDIDKFIKIEKCFEKYHGNIYQVFYDYFMYDCDDPLLIANMIDISKKYKFYELNQHMLYSLYDKLVNELKYYHVAYELAILIEKISPNNSKLLFDCYTKAARVCDKRSYKKLYDMVRDGIGCRQNERLEWEYLERYKITHPTS
jgi:hypothetical protein